MNRLSRVIPALLTRTSTVPSILDVIQRGRHRFAIGHIHDDTAPLRVTQGLGNPVRARGAGGRAHDLVTLSGQALGDRAPMAACAGDTRLFSDMQLAFR